MLNTRNFFFTFSSASNWTSSTSAATLRPEAEAGEDSAAATRMKCATISLVDRSLLPSLSLLFSGRRPSPRLRVGSSRWSSVTGSSYRLKFKVCICTSPLQTLSGQLNSSKLNMDSWTKLLNKKIIEQEAIEQLYDWTRHNWPITNWTATLLTKSSIEHGIIEQQRKPWF